MPINMEALIAFKVATALAPVLAPHMATDARVKRDRGYGRSRFKRDRDSGLWTIDNTFSF